MLEKPLVVELADCTTDHHVLAGGKACGLGSLIQNGFHVPPGFVLTTRAYREHVEHNQLVDDLERLVADCTSFEAQLRAAEEIQRLFENSSPPASIEEAVHAAHARLCTS